MLFGWGDYQAGHGMAESWDDLSPPQSSDHRSPEQGDEYGGEQDLGCREQLQSDRDTEGDAALPRAKALPDKQLGENQKHEGRRRADDQVRMADRMRQHVWREAVDEPTNESAQPVSDQGIHRQIRTPGRGGQAEGHHQVVGGDRPQKHHQGAER